jgi:hypothetical protein
MMKKLMMMVCASTLFAGSAQASWEGNWLFGVTGGYAEQDADFELNIGHPAPTRAVTTVTKSFDTNEYIWGILAGYQVRCCNWLIGGEVNVDWRDLNNRHDYAFSDPLGFGWNGNTEYRQNTVVGLTARFGYEVTPCLLPYIRLGAETSDDHLNVTISRLAGLASFTEGSRRQYRFVGGVGAEVPIPAFCGLTFRLEYNYYSQGKGVNADGYASDGLTFVSSNATMKTSAGKASLVYNFM